MDIKKKSLLAGLLALCALVSCNKGGNDPRLIIFTYDGLRWSEVFKGADSLLINNPAFVKDIPAAKAAYWRDTPEERREALMPFVWEYVPKHGYLIGNREKDSRVQLANSMGFSYPGYSEMFCGYADDERVNSNDPKPNPNTSVLEVVNKDPRYKGHVMMYSSWESIRFAVNNDRGGFPGSAAFEPGLSDTPTTKLLNQIQDGQPKVMGTGERWDNITFGFAMETLRKDHPKVFYIGFGDTDELGHAGEYKEYLDGTRWTDGFIRSIVEACEADPFYKDKTTYLLLCDHGRGRGGKWKGHGADLRGSDETFFICFGKDAPVLGETSHNGPFYNKQLAATIADILGVDFTPDNGEKCAPIDPEFYEEPKIPEDAASFPAVNAVPKGKGLAYTYTEGDFMSVGEAFAAPVKARGVVPVFSTEPKLREDHFGFTYKGLVKIEKEGLYLLSLASDDGSKLWLDGELLFDIDRDGGGFSESWLNLGAGYHRIEVRYFENYGGETLEVGIEGCGLSEENLPAGMLFHE